jgi:1,4-alpha-glucan branching enzyme
VASNRAPLVDQIRYYAEARCRFAAGVTLLSADVPMFLFGEEVGSQQKFLYDRVLDNREDYATLRQTTGSGMFRFYSELINLRKSNSAMHGPQLEVLYVHNANRVLAFRRWDMRQQFLVFASLNNSPFNSPNYLFQSQMIGAGRWKEVFNSDAAAYGGRDIGNAGANLESSQGAFACVVPANGFVVFQGLD